MNDDKYTDKYLIIYQKLSWYLAILFFGVIAFLFIINSPLAFRLSQIGIVMILVTTFLKLIIMAEKFRAVRRIRLMILSYFLMLLLLSTILLRYLL